MELKVLLYGAPIFSEPSQPVGQRVPIDRLLEDMRAAQQLFRQPCIAAKHLGVNVQLLLINTSFDRNRSGAPHRMVVLVNPEVVSKSAPLLAGLESDPCIPDYQGSVERHSAVELKYLDEQFNPKQETFTDIAARWVLHGIELLEGRTFIDNLNVHRQRSIKGHLKRIAPQEENGKSDMPVNLQ